MKNKQKLYGLLILLIAMSLALSYYMGRVDESLQYASMLFDWVAGIAMAALFVMLCIPKKRK